MEIKQLEKLAKGKESTMVMSKGDEVRSHKLYGMQNAAGEWYYPIANALSIGHEHTTNVHVKNGELYFDGYWLDYMAVDGDKMPVHRVVKDGNVVLVHMRLNPDDIDQKMFDLFRKADKAI